ncbi:MFS transporter [Streptomyces sp. S1A1-8]|uniref:MFS transporter n=1 Tax=unclassified Streptomyces TaxID=2593676 RepID=UPI0011639E47|nr:MULTISPECIES: MFS transporter [unclassified Streptomyces]QDO25649.1 MFS transporter [Streptomyces sp. S1A1-8]QDO35766.1 MFS transporter [Streptomyces sp. S1A1-3]
MAAPSTSARPWREEISKYQWAVLFATTLGWALDGFDSSLFTQVAAPATADLLNRPSTFHTGLVVTLFLAGWATGAILFGAVADYIGRVRVLIIGVLTYSVFTAATVFVTEYWQFALVRFIAGIGSGVELPVGAALVAEAWNNRHRAKASSVMMSGLAIGSLLSALVYYFVGGLGWRQTLAFGLAPALLALFIRRHIHEPATTAEVKAQRAARRQERAAGAAKTADDRFVLNQLFSRPLVGRTVACTLICCGALFAFWSVTTWTPQIIRVVVANRGVTGEAAVPYVSWATAALNVGGLLGYASWGFIADRIGRRRTYAMSLLIGITGILALYPFADSYTTYLWLLPVVGFGVFGVLSGNAVFFPELFGPSVRASAIAVTNSIGRFLTAAGPLSAGAIATTWFDGNLARATTAVSMLIVIAFIGLWFTPETHGRFLYSGAPTSSDHTSHTTDRMADARQPEAT